MKWFSLLTVIITIEFCSLRCAVAQTSASYLESGKVHSENFEYEKARNDFNRAIELDPKNAEAYFERGCISMFRDKLASMQDFNKAIELDPLYSWAFYMASSLALDFADYNRASSHAERAISAELSKFQHSLSNAREHEETRLFLSNAYHNLGMAKYELGNHSGAIQSITVAIDLNPDEPTILSRQLTLRGKSKLQLKDYRGAIQDANRAIELSESEHDPYLVRGFSSFHLGMKDSACLDFSRAGELGYSEIYETIKQVCN